VNYNLFLEPDSKTSVGFQTTVQKLQRLESGPVCHQMASSALIHTCGTLRSQDGAQEPTDMVLEGEKKLFATRSAVCELLDSRNPGVVPMECSSFIPTEANTEKKGRLGYYSANGHEILIPRYPDYDVDTKRDVDQCVAALNKSPQTWGSYSNAKQSANQMCPEARVAAEKDELLRIHVAGAEAAKDNHDAFRSQTEALLQQEKVFQNLEARFQNMVKNAADQSELSEKRASDATDAMQAFLRAFEGQFTEMRNQLYKESQDHERKARAESEGWFSSVQSAWAQKSTDVALAQAKNNQDARDQMEYLVEYMQQSVMQVFNDASSREQEMAISSSQALQGLQQVNAQLANVGENVMGLDQFFTDAKTTMQGLQDQHEHLASVINNATTSVAALSSQVLVISGHISAMLGTITGIFERLPSVAWYFRYVLVAAVILLLKFCIGGPSFGSICGYSSTAIYNAVACSARIVKRGVVATAGFVQLSARVVSHSMDIPGAVLMLLAAVIIAIYFLAIESPVVFVQRWEAGEFTRFDVAFLAAVIGLPAAYAAIITLKHLRRGGLADQEEDGLVPMCEAEMIQSQFDNTQSYDNEKWVV
jgi:hypothetical protein